MPKTKRGREIVQARSRKGHQEKKYFDGTLLHTFDSAGYNTWTALTWDTGGASDENLICTPIQGNNIWDRTGRFIEISEVRFKGVIDWNAVDFYNSEVVQNIRIVMVLDKQVDKSAWAGVDTVFQTAAQGDTQATFFKPFAPMNLGEFGRYRVLSDKTYTRPNVAGADYNTVTSSDQIASTKVKITHKFLRPLKVNYGPSATNGDEQNVVDNGIRMMVIHTGESSTYTGGSAIDPQLRGWVRSGFYDHRAVAAPRTRWSKNYPRTYGFDNERSKFMRQ